MTLCLNLFYGYDRISTYNIVGGHFEDPSGRKKAQQQGQQMVGKQVAKPSSLSGRNDGS